MLYNSYELINNVEHLSISEDEIHLYLIEINKVKFQNCNYYNYLAEDEKVKANKYHFEKDKNVFSIVRAFTRILLAKYLGENYQKITFYNNDYGKPFLKSTIKSNINFNISHSNNIGLLAFTKDDKIGVDIEFINKNIVIQDIYKNYFSLLEQKELLSLNQDEQINNFFRLWTRKEAFIKAEGKGLSIPLNSFDVSLDENNPKITRIKNKHTVGNWNIYNLSLNSKYCSAVVNNGVRKKLVNNIIELN